MNKKAGGIKRTMVGEKGGRKHVLRPEYPGNGRGRRVAAKTRTASHRTLTTDDVHTEEGLRG